MHFNVAGFGWHATIFLNGWALLFTGSAVIAVAVLIFKIVHRAGWSQ